MDEPQWQPARIAPVTLVDGHRDPMGYWAASVGKIISIGRPIAVCGICGRKVYEVCPADLEKLQPCYAGFGLCEIQFQTD